MHQHIQLDIKNFAIEYFINFLSLTSSGQPGLTEHRIPVLRQALAVSSKLIRTMKLLLFPSILFLIVSCKTTNSSIKPIDASDITKIELLIADTSIIDLPSKQLTKLIDIGEGQSFVDSSGNPLYKPSQIITFTSADKDSLVHIFNSFLDSLQPDIESTTCITLYNHVFLLYDKKNNIQEQVDFAFDCPMQFDFLHRGKIVTIKHGYSELMTRFVKKLKLVDAFIPVYGPPPPPK